jgi:hypothetical protein
MLTGLENTIPHQHYYGHNIMMVATMIRHMLIPYNGTGPTLGRFNQIQTNKRKKSLRKTRHKNVTKYKTHLLPEITVVNIKGNLSIKNLYLHAKSRLTLQTEEKCILPMYSVVG